MQFRSSFRAVSEQFQSSFRAISATWFRYSHSITKSLLHWIKIFAYLKWSSWRSAELSGRHIWNWKRATFENWRHEVKCRIDQWASLSLRSLKSLLQDTKRTAIDTLLPFHTIGPVNHCKLSLKNGHLVEWNWRNCGANRHLAARFTAQLFPLRMGAHCGVASFTNSHFNSW